MSISVPNASHIGAALREAEKEGDVKCLVECLRALAAQAGLGLDSTEPSAEIPAVPAADSESATRTAFYVQRTYLPFVHKLVHGVGSAWLPLISELDRKACFDIFFTPRHPEGAHASLLGLGAAITTCEDSFTLKRVLYLAQNWFEQGGIDSILSGRCSTGQEEVQMQAVQVLISFPDRVANRLEGRVPRFFALSQYFPNLIRTAIESAQAVIDAPSSRKCTNGTGRTDVEGSGFHGGLPSGNDMVNWDWIGHLLGSLARGGQGKAVAEALCSLLDENGGISRPGGKKQSESEAKVGGRPRWGAAGMDERRAEEEQVAEEVRALASSDRGQLIRRLVLGVPEASVEALLGAVVASASPARSCAALLLCLGSELPQAKRLLADKFLVGRTWTSQSCQTHLLWAILAGEAEFRRLECASPQQQAEGPVVGALRTLGKVWGEAHFVQYGGGYQQQQVTWLLQGCLRHVRGREDLEAHGLVQIVVGGVQVRMESPIADRREDAKRTAEMFAFRLDPTHPLKFDEDNGTDASDEEVADGGDEVAIEQRSSGQRSGESSAWSEGGAQAKGKLAPRERGVAKPDLADPDRVVLDDDSASEEESSDETASDDDAARSTSTSDSDSDSDDGLVPYDMEEEETAAPGSALPCDEQPSKRIGADRVPLPTRLRQCLAGLRSQNADEVEAALFAVEEVVQASQGVGGGECVELARVLLRLEDRVAMEDFEGKRHAGLVAVTCKDPTHVAPQLSSAVWDGNERLSAKLDALEVLSEAAFVLSALPQPPAMPPASEQEGRQTAGRSRRWSRKSQVRRAEARANAFGQMVQGFFFALLAGWDAKSAPRLLGADFVLAGRVVAVLGCYVECSGNSPATVALAAALMQLLAQRAVRLHCESFVRRCVQYALSRVLLAVPERLFGAEFQQDLGWLQDWLREALQEDADREVAKMAGGNLQLVLERAAIASPPPAAWPDVAVRAPSLRIWD